MVGSVSLTALLLGTQNTVGHHISKGLGVGIIVGTVVVVAVVILVVWFLVARLLQGPVTRRAHRRGHAGRV